MLTIIYVVIIAVPLIWVLRRLLKQHIPIGLKELPSASGWPFIGVVFSMMGQTRFEYLFRQKLKHGPIFKFTFGCRDIIVLNTGTIMNRTLKEMGNNFSGRWKNILVQYLHHNSGILFKDKEWWAIQRSFVLKVLRDFGLGKQRSQEIVNLECSFLLKEIEESCGQVISARCLFPKFMVNVISKLVMNIRFERSDSNFQALTSLIEKHAQSSDVALTLNLMYPILESLPIISKFILWCCGRDKESLTGYQFIKNIINDHEKRFSASNDGEDLIDLFLKEKHKLDDENIIKNHTFTEWQLIRVVYELFGAGYETTTTTLSWSMLLLAKHPNIQEKVYREIMEVVGPSRSSNLIDKKSMNYTQAVMDEIFRVSSVVPLALPHRVFEATTLDGFFIPKNSIVFPNIYGIHHDQDTWKKPFEFYPEHFLTQIDGISNYTAKENLMPFSVGKRQCLGESLARLEFFTFLTSILQRFKVKFPKPMSDEEFKRITSGTDGTIRAPLNTDIVFEVRQT